ncbi:hypothetical protein QYE76_063181 [Lolium multiflorum]|uniref:Uncharacterized protein n=1 Tax=Lolium multiflorum TaxID=4521 RepID=A0AAD8W6B3_LOLMU|nr:hypothetical protein QYE76_063181 [Lolium multiflorum]
MENYSLLMGAAAVMKMAVEMAGVSIEKPSGHFLVRRHAGAETRPPDLGFAMAAALELFSNPSNEIFSELDEINAWFLFCRKHPNTRAAGGGPCGPDDRVARLALARGPMVSSPLRPSTLPFRLYKAPASKTLTKKPAHPKLSTPPDTGGAHTPPLRRHAVLPSYLMASSAAEPPPPPPPPPGGGEGSASTRSRSTPVAVEFVYPSGVPTLPVSRGEDWESEGSNAWIPSGIDPALAFRLVVRLDSSFTRDSKRLMNGFYFPAVVATTISLRDLKANIFDKYSWSSLDAVHFEYFNSTERRLVPLISDDDLGILFALNASCHFGKIRVHVDRGQASSGVGASSGGRASCLSTAAASANSVRRGDPCRSTAAPSVPSASGSQIVPVVNVEDDAEIGDQSPEDDEDELMFPELVDRCSKQAMEDQYMEDIAFGARFDETDDEEKNENDDSLVLADYEGEDLPTIEWNREDPQLAKGTVFQTMMDCRNAITTYHILTKNNYEVIKSEPDQAGAENAEENEAAIQLEIEAAVQHEEIEAANAEEIEAAVQHEEIEPMDREQREQMDVERLQPMSPEESEQYYRDCLDSCKAMCDAHFEELMAEEKAEASQKKKNKKEGKRKVDTGNIPGRVTRSKVVAPASHTRSKKKILF